MPEIVIPNLGETVTGTAVGDKVALDVNVLSGGGDASDVNVSEFGGVAVTIGQQLSSASIPVTQGTSSMQAIGRDATGQDAYATVKTPSANAAHIDVSCGANGATISLDGGVTDHIDVPANTTKIYDDVTITSGVAIQAKNLVGGSNYTNLAVSVW